MHLCISLLSSAEHLVFQEVTESEYRTQLLSIGINVAAKNFIVFQGQIESFAAMTALERTKILEELSG